MIKITTKDGRPYALGHPVTFETNEIRDEIQLYMEANESIFLHKKLGYEIIETENSPTGKFCKIVDKDNEKYRIISHRLVESDASGATYEITFNKLLQTTLNFDKMVKALNTK